VPDPGKKITGEAEYVILDYIVSLRHASHKIHGIFGFDHRMAVASPGQHLPGTREYRFCPQFKHGHSKTYAFF
jgi:hypothetical protein